MNHFKTIAFKDGSKSLDVRVSVEDGTIWLSKNEMATLFEYGTSTIWRHIKSTYKEFEIQGCSGYAKNARTLCKDGKYYNIPVYSEQVIKRIAERLNSDKYTKLSNYLRNNNVESEQQDNIIIYNNGTINLDVGVSPKEDTVWLSQAQMAALFDTSRQNITIHIQNIFNEGELTRDSVSKDFLHTATDGKQYLMTKYNLDMILAVGYRIKGNRAIEFRKWVSVILKQYLIDGYAINDKRVCSYSDIILNIEKETLELRNQLELLKKNFDYGIAKEKIFFSGQIFDAHEYLCSIVRQATKCIRIIDPFVDDEALAILTKSQNIQRYIYTTNPVPMNKKDIGAFKTQYGHLEMKYIKKFHDRFIIIDDKYCFSLGTSINGVGLKTFAIIELKDEHLIQSIIDLVNS